MIRLLFFAVLLSFTSLLYSQSKTYKVVCDKTDNKLKVVEADNRSSNLVPIKSGFPFPAIARKWIEDNYATDDCDAEQIVNDIKNQNQQNQPNQQNAQQQEQQVQKRTTVPTTASPSAVSVNQNIDYNNTSFGINLLMTDFGRYLGLSENLVLGLDVNFEQLIGKKIYMGSGVHYMAFNSKFTSSDDDEDPVELYAFKIPFFVGTRIVRNNSYISYEGGICLNTSINSLDSDNTSLRGRIPLDNSLDFMIRLKVGGKSVAFEVGTNIWLTDIVEEQESQKLTMMHMGLLFSF